MTAEARIARHRELAEGMMESYREGYKTGTLNPPLFGPLMPRSQDSTFHVLSSGTVSQVGGIPDFPSIGGVSAAEAEMKFAWWQIPNFRLTESHIFPTEEGVAVFWKVEGEVADTPRARSLGVAGKTLQFDEIDIFTINDEGEITRQAEIFTASEAITPLCGAGAEENTGEQQAPGDGGFSIANYVDRLSRFSDRDKPTKFTRQVPHWFVDGKVVPMPSTD